MTFRDRQVLYDDLPGLAKWFLSVDKTQPESGFGSSLRRSRAAPKYRLVWDRSSEGKSRLAFRIIARIPHATYFHNQTMSSGQGLAGLMRVGFHATGGKQLGYGLAKLPRCQKAWDQCLMLRCHPNLLQKVSRLFRTIPSALIPER
jgi:hypothetical protein